MKQSSLFEAVVGTALQTWVLTLPCRFGQRATWERPVYAIGWAGPDHCALCAAEGR